MPEIDTSCPCGCTEPVVTGYQYAGTDERQRERHRARANRQRATAGRAEQGRLEAARAMLPELGLDPLSPAHEIAQRLRAQADLLQHLAVVVADELASADLDAVRDMEQRLLAAHRLELAGVQAQLDEARTARRQVQSSWTRSAEELEAVSAALVEVQRGHDQLLEERDRLLAQTQMLHTDLATTEQAMTANGDALEQMTAQALTASQEFAFQTEGRQRAESALAQALTDLREQQARTAEALTAQELRFHRELLEAQALADRRAVRDRRFVVQQLRAALTVRPQE